MASTRIGFAGSNTAFLHYVDACPPSSCNFIHKFTNLSAVSKAWWNYAAYDHVMQNRESKVAVDGLAVGLF
jgi:hypothetical protein